MLGLRSGTWVFRRQYRQRRIKEVIDLKGCRREGKGLCLGGAGLLEEKAITCFRCAIRIIIP